MCGIIAIVRKPDIGTVPSAAGLCSDLADAVEAFDPTAGELDTALLALASTMKSVDSALRGVTGVVALITDPQAADGIAVVLDAATGKLVDTEDRIEREVVGGAELERRNAALGGRQGCLLGHRPGPSAHRSEGRTSGGPLGSGVGPRCRDVHPRGAVRHRPTRGPRVATQPACRCWSPGTSWTSPIPACSRCSEPARRSAVPERVGAVVDGVLSVRLQGRRRDRRAGRQHGGSATAIAADELLRRCARRATRRRPSCSATPAGPASGSSARPTRTRSTGRAGDGSTGPTSLRALNGDVDNFAELSAARRARRSAPRSPPTRRSSRR